MGTVLERRKKQYRTVYGLLDEDSIDDKGIAHQGDYHRWGI